MVKTEQKWFPVEERSTSKEYPLMPAVLTLYRIVTSDCFKEATGVIWEASFLLDADIDSFKNYVRQDQWDNVCSECYMKVKRSPGFQEKLVKEFVKKTPKFLKFCRDIYKSNCGEKSNKELWEDYKKYISLYEDIYIWGEAFAFGARFQLSDYLSDYLKERAALLNS